MEKLRTYGKIKELKRIILIGTSAIVLTGTVTGCVRKSKEEVFLDNLEKGMNSITVQSFADEEKMAQDFYGNYRTGYHTSERFEKAFKEKNGTDTIEKGDTALIPILLDEREFRELADYLSRENDVHMDVDTLQDANLVMDETDFIHFRNDEDYRHIRITTYYTVQPTEQLDEIALRFKTDSSQITLFDGSSIPDKNWIYTGQILKINTYQYILDEMENEMVAQNNSK